MSRAKKTPHFVWHCSAGFSPVKDIEHFWKNTLGWKHKGYAVIIELDGTIWWLHDNTAKNGYKKEFTEKAFEFVTNGVKGFNYGIVNGCTIGGVEKKKGKYIAKDTRTEAQKESQLIVLKHYFEWLKKNGGDVEHTQIEGHRDYSKDVNGNGIIDSWERIKECPSYDVIPEFKWLTVNKDNPGDILPNK